MRSMRSPGRVGVNVLDSRVDTYRHIQTVQQIMAKAIADLQRRSLVHDQSKLASPEVEIFDEMTPKLAASTYGSDEYKGFLAQMKPALDHHYAANDHHPEHYQPKPYTYFECGGCFKRFPSTWTKCCDACGYTVYEQPAAATHKPEGLHRMSLSAVLEMLCDWLAATKRHNDGDIRKSIEINQKRFGYSDELKQILLNSLPVLEG